ncbi:MAG: Asp23/Gls24 family envelope stress response protein [Acidimicrobiia bacterium]|nr:Asp23/Gls24 family envelope stress response protein [Acidimicrobiia bacterium]
MSDPTTPTPTPTSTSLTPTAGGATGAETSPLLSEKGNTIIAESVVAKIAGIATREIAGVHAMGSGSARAIGALRDRLPGSSATRGVTQGVSVEVGERQTAVDLDIVVEYGVPIVDVANSVRSNVSNRVERMTGLEVTEVNVAVDDIFLEDQSEEPPAPERVQ